MNEKTKEQETESRPEDAQASEQVKAVVRSLAHCKIITKHQITNEYISINKLHIAQILYGDGWVSLIMPSWLSVENVKCKDIAQAKDVLYEIFAKWALDLKILCA